LQLIEWRRNVVAGFASLLKNWPEETDVTAQDKQTLAAKIAELDALIDLFNASLKQK
jgi:hypothetical protein